MRAQLWGSVIVVGWAGARSTFVMNRFAASRTRSVIQNRLERHGFGIGGAAGLGALDGRVVRGGDGACEAISGYSTRFMIGGMATPQGGIFALGTASHAYLEFDASRPEVASRLIAAVASLREPRTTMGGVNLVAGFRPELWRDAMPDDAPAGLEGFNHDLVGTDGFVMPASQHDAVMWISGSAYDVGVVMAGQVVA